MRKICFVGVVLLAFQTAAKADACKDMMNGFAAEMDRLAAAYDKMKTFQEMCSYGSSNAIPTRKRIVAKIEASSCPNMAGPLKYSQDALQRSITETEESCRKAGK